MAKQKKDRPNIAFLSTFFYHRMGRNLWTFISDAAKVYDINLHCYIGGNYLQNNDLFSHGNLIYKFIRKNFIDGIIFWYSDLTAFLDKKNALDFFSKFKDIPIVTVGYSDVISDIPMVYLDEESCTRNIMKHLIHHHNYKKIAHIRGPETHVPSQIRFRTYLDELKNNDIEINYDLISEPAQSWRQNDALKAIELFLDRRKLKPKTDIEAIFSVSDFFALQAMDEIKRRKYSIPDDIAVIGFNNSVESWGSCPSLTTCDINHFSLGNNAIKILTDIINGKKISNNRHPIQGELIVRESCGCYYPHSGSLNDFDKDDRINNLLKESSGQIYDEIMKSFEINPDILNPELILSLFNSLIVDINNDNSNRFILIFQKLVMSLKNENSDLNICRKLISAIEKKILSLNKKSKISIKIEEIIFNVHILINNAVKNIFPLFDYKQTDRIRNIPSFGLKLMHALTVTELKNVLTEELINMGIISCYISLFDDIEAPLKSSHIIYAFRENKLIDLNSINCHFPSFKLIPDELMFSEKQYQFIIQSLLNRGEQFGFVVFEIETIEINNLEIIKNLINGVFERALLAEERENLLKDLEKKVEERTSELKDINEQLRSAIDEVNKANKAKSDFLTTISHEIKTPLSIMIGLVEKILKIKDVNDQKKLGDLIFNESIKITELINQLLDLSKIEAGKLMIQDNSFNFINMMEDLKEAYLVIAQKKGLYFSMIVDNNIPAMLSGDELRLRQVIINLAGNAVKFTEKGSITIRVDIDNLNDNNIMLLFKVIDTGIGIPVEKQELIFNIFTQGEDIFSSKFGGTGLGTTISKQLVELMGGKIGVESTAGKGSTFWFTMPFELI